MKKIGNSGRGPGLPGGVLGQSQPKPTGTGKGNAAAKRPARPAALPVRTSGLNGKGGKGGY